MKKGNVFKRIFATALAVTLIFSNGYSTIPFIGSKAVGEVQAESEPSLILKPKKLYDGGYVVKSEKDENDNVIKWIEQAEEFNLLEKEDLSEENNFDEKGKEIKYSAGGQSVLYIDKGTCLDCEFEADEDFSYFDAYLTNKDGEQLGGYKKVSSNDQSSDSSLSRATLTNNDAIPGSSYIVTKKNGHFQICVNDDAYITLYYHSKNGDVLTGFILKIVALQKTEDFTVKGQDTVVATRKANFTVENPKGGTVGGTDGFRWSVDSSVGSFSKTDRDKAIFTAADAANGKEGSFTVTPYSGIDKSSESNAIIAIKKRGASKTFDINIAKRVKASSVNFKISDQDENYVEETIDDNISDDDWEQLKATNPTHYYERDGKRYVKYAKYYLAKGSSYLLNDKFDYLPKNSNDIFKYTSSDSRFVTVMQNGTIKGISPGITSITVSPEDENAISDKAYIEVYVQTTDLKPQKEDGTKITSYSMRSSNDIEIDVVEDKDSTERIEALVSHKVSGSNKAYTANVTKRDEVRQLDTEIQWMDGDDVVLTQTLLNPEEYFSTNIKKYKFTAGTILDKQELTVTFKTNRTSGYLENSTDVSTYVSLDLYPMYEGALSLKSASDTDELWTGESDTVSAIVDTSNVADQIDWDFSVENIDSEGNCLTIDSVDYTNNKVNISAKRKPDSGYVNLIAMTKSNPSKTATMRINVKQTAKSVKITGDQAKPTVNVGREIQLTATQEPVTSDETIEWTSSNNGILTVDENGIVKGVSAGTAIVTAKTSHSNKTAKISVMIVEAGIVSIKKTNTVEADDIGSIDGVVNSSLSVYAVVVNKDNTMQTTAKVDWTVANPEVVDVSYKNDTHTQVSLDFKKVGTTTITVESGEATKTYEVTVTAPISDSKFVSIGGIEDYVYLPNGKIPEINEKAISLVDSRGDNWLLENGNDYETSNSYSEGGKAGTYKYTLSQAEGGLYTGSKDVSYNIYKKSLGNGTTADDEIDVKVTDVVYNGKAQLPKLDITYKVGDNEQKLIQGQDYTVSTGFTNVGEYEITISGASNGNFKDSFKVSYNILPFDLEANLEDSVRFFDGKQLVDKDSIKDQTYTGSEIKPDSLVMVRVSFDKGATWPKTNLAYKTDGSGDVKYSYSNNIDAGTATVTITGTKNYTGSISTTFEIEPKSISDNGVTFDDIANQEYTSKEVTPDVSGKYNSMTLVKDKDYTLDYDNNIDSYVATGNKNALVNVNGTGNYTGFKQLKFVIDQVDLSDKTKVTIDEIPDQYQCGTFLRPDVTARYGDYVLVEGKDYTTFYGKDNGKDKTYNVLVDNGNEGVAAILPVTNGNFKATRTTSVSKKNGQEIFFNIIDKLIKKPADDITIKRIVDGGTAELIGGAIYVNATGGVSKNNTVSFEIEAVRNDNEESDDPVYVLLPGSTSSPFTCDINTVNISKGNKAVVEITGGTKAAQGSIKLMTQSGEVSKDVTVFVNDPATKVELAYDTAKYNGNYATKIENKSTTVYENRDYQLVANLSRGKTDSVTWTSSNESVAVVDENGRVTALKQGSARITATTNPSELYEGGVKGTVTFNVIKNSVANSVTIDKETLTLQKGKTEKLTGTAKGLNNGVVTESLEWTTSDEKVVKITSGQDTNIATIEAVAPGTAKVYYGSKLSDGKRGYCEVTVFVPVESIALDMNTKTVEAGNTFELTATLNELATDTFIWESSNPEIVSIDNPDSTEAANSQTVTIHGLTPNQTATITVKAASKDKVVATCKVTVTDRLADNVTIDKTSLTVNAGETFKLKGSASNVNGEVTEALLWGFPTDKLECIDGAYSDEATFRAKQTSGTAIITYGSNDQNGKIARCEVTIINSNLVLDTYKVTLTPNGTAKLTATYPAGTVGGFVWTSSDENVVKIKGTSDEKSNSQIVEIVGVGAGKTAQITVASVDDSNIKAVCDVTVNHIMADKVTIDPLSLQLELGKTKDLIGTASSNIGTVTESLEWSTSNSGVVALVGDLSSYTITVKAVAAGTATITYGSKTAGGKTATCTIVVKDSNSGSGGNSGGNDGGNSGGNGGNSGGNGGGSSGGSNENVLEPGKTATVAGVTYVVNKDSTVTYAGNPKAKGTVRIPASVKIAGKTINVTSIKAGAFKNNKNITSVIIGNNVKTIGNNAFAGCVKLKKVTIGKNVKSIGNNAFKGCKLITTITIPAKVTSIGSNAFAGCSKLKIVTFKTTKLKKVGKGAFKTIKVGARFKCPNAKLKNYTKLLKKSGLPKKAKITK